MRLPFSYRQQFFMPFLALSIAGHGIFFGAQGWLHSDKPHYAVDQGRSSMEVVIVEQTPETPVKEPPKVLTALKNSPEIIHQKQERKLVKKPSKSAYIPPQQGSLTRFLEAHLKNPAPPYPQIARENGWEGLVVLEVSVSREGTAESVTVVQGSGYKILDQAALKTVRKWRFLPARTDRLAFSSSVRIPVRFLLEDLH